jgi:hypothetical protein
VLKNAIDRLVDGWLEFEILGLEIDEIHGSVLALHTQGGNTPNHPWLISQAVFLPKIIEANLQAEMASKAARIFCHISVILLIQSLFNWRIRMQAFVLQEVLI